ncbi:mammalian cell entry protein [Mycolicibacterium moriokaense]|uniref:Mce/MlaD domain-containing protein n=1 Tax=Mycolicibacterium moriokaense TaxID=39691 RepID=A0AAD1M4C2_9MYCO|nr:MlaD family protein [Mycolicibacterium moriokaense]MCV7039144.1 MCE family protein [Mycolicibacterium moriokaense]ORB18566.1 mammalian cell entry protein [Mycolicibacterium moriokaense]BBX00047.1 hypothetical protein MMOR_09830 [Mycolicibacterium moriokaense]
MNFLRNPTLWGVGALVMVVVLALTATVLYVSPPGQKTVAFYTDDAASIRPGDTVRIAGITVGKVEDLSVEPNQVRVRAKVDNEAFVGDKSHVEVRMLTVVGGYYVNLISLGDDPLGSNTIPVEHVTMPYSLVRTLTDATKITERVDPKPINQSLDELQQGLTGANVSTLSALLDAGNSLTETIDRQRGQISSILDVSDEYIEGLANYKDGLRQLALKAALVEQILVLYGKGFGGALMGIGKVVESLSPVGAFYLDHRDEFLAKIREWQDRVRRWVDNNSRIVPRLRRIRDKIDRVLDAQNARPELLATDVCIPMPGSPC